MGAHPSLAFRQRRLSQLSFCRALPPCRPFARSRYAALASNSHSVFWPRAYQAPLQQGSSLPSFELSAELISQQARNFWVANSLALSYYRIMRSKLTSASCPTCDTRFERLPVEYDDGGYAFLEVRACADSTCGKMLCSCCDQFHCDGCGQPFCTDHLVSVPDGTGRPLHCCPTCAAECEVLALPPRISPASEIRPILPAEAA